MSGLDDMILSMHNHYMVWGGRVLTHFVASLFLFLPKWVFNIANTLVYLYFTWLIYKMATVHSKKPQLLMYVFVHLGLWFFLPRYGQNILWLIGSCNYLWAAMFILAFVWPYFEYAATEKAADSKWKNVLWPLLGILAGWGNENTSGAGIMLVVLLLIICKIQKKRWHLWCITGLVGQITGFLFLILAPGNFGRLGHSTESESFLIKYSGRLNWILQLLDNHLIRLLLVCMAAFVIVCFLHRKKEQVWIAASLLASGIACHFAMLLSPEYPERALIGTVMFLLIGLLYSVSVILERETQGAKMVVWVAASCMLMTFAFGFLTAFMDIGYTYRTANRREESIIEQREAGERDITTYKITPQNNHNAGYGLYDIEGKTSFWTNEIIARYYEVDTIISYEE